MEQGKKTTVVTRMTLDIGKIRVAMARKCWDVNDLAVHFGAPKVNVQGILNRQRVRPKTAGMLALALGVDVTEIVKDEG